MRLPRLALWPTGLAFGLAAEWVGRPALSGVDASTGFALLLLGLVAWARRPASSAAPIMAAAGFAWFLGTAWEPAVYLHRGALAHLLLSYPRGRSSSRLDQAGILVAYAYAVIYPVAADDSVTAGFAVALVLLAARRFARAARPERRARLAALAAAAGFGLVVAGEAASRIAGTTAVVPELFLYDLVVLLTAVGIFADLCWGRWTRAAVTGLVVELGAFYGSAPLRDRLARMLGDPSLVLAYKLPGSAGYFDESGRPVAFPTDGEGRAVTPVDEEGTQVAALIHDRTLLNDPELMSAVATATRLAVSNAQLQARARARAAEVDASRRRIVEAADTQRRQFERELRDGAGRRLARVEQLAFGINPGLTRELALARRELDEFARGIHPQTLTAGGLATALADLAARSTLPVKITVGPRRFAPGIEAAAYFVCSEALANVAKHARASRVAISAVADGAWLRLEVVDDGEGGARIGGGSGMRGLFDRVEALGGRLSLDSPPSRGTRLVAELPLDDAFTQVGQQPAVDSASEKTDETGLR